MRSVTAPDTGSAFSIASSSVSTPSPVAADSATAERRPARPAAARGSSSRSALVSARTGGRAAATPSSASRGPTPAMRSSCAPWLAATTGTSAPPTGALQPAVRLHAFELALELLHALADHAAVGLELRLTGTARADAAAQALEVLPLADEPRQQVRELRQLDLELALGAARALGEDVEDERGAVDHLDAERLAEVALLDRRERIVGDEQIDAARARGLGHFRDLAAAEVERGRRRRPLLDHPLADARAGRRGEPRQLLQRLLDVDAPLLGAPQRRQHRMLAPASHLAAAP